MTTKQTLMRVLGALMVILFIMGGAVITFGIITFSEWVSTP